MPEALEQQATTYEDLIASDPSFETQVWEDVVHEEYKKHDVFNQFTGGEGSGKPVVKKSEEPGLKQGKTRKVSFTNVARIGGQGVMDEVQLTGNEAKLNFATYDLTLGLLRHAVGWTQVLGLFRLGRGTPSQISAALMAEWYGQKVADDKMVALRDDALKSSTDNLYVVGGYADFDDLESADTISTQEIENSKGMLQGNGFKPIEMESGQMGSENPQALFFGADEGLRALKSQTTYLAAVKEARERSSSNPQFTGHYVNWDGNIIFRHNVVESTTDGRLGTPLRPMARLGTALADATPTSLTGGGSLNPAGVSDYFANFPGFPWKFHDDQVLPTDNRTYYAIIFNPTDKKYEGVSYTAAGFAANGSTLTVTRAVASVLDTGHARYSNAHPEGALIIPCTSNGVPFTFFLHMGQMALCQGTGVFELEQISRKDDYANKKGQAHLEAIGIQATRGFAAYQDVRGRRPNYMLVAAALELPQLDLVPYSS